MSMSMTKTGDWKKCDATLNNMQLVLPKRVRGKVIELAEEVCDKLKAHIKNQDLDWPELSGVTVTLKGHDMIYIESEFLVNNLQTVKISSDEVFVGIPNNIIHPSGVNLSDIMGYLEYGMHNMPPRPLIRPVFEEFKAAIQRTFWQYLKDFMSKGGA